MPRRHGPLAIALLAGALLGVAPAGVRAEDHQKAPDPEATWPPSARPGPVEQPGVVEPTDATMDFPEAIMRGLGLYTEPTPEERAAEAAKRFHWNAVPFILTNPLVGFGFGVAGAGIIRFDDDVAKLSKFSTNILYTVKNQLSIPLRTSIFFGSGNWSLVGYANWQIFPAPTWGLGGNTPNEAEVIVDKSLLRFWETAYRRVVDDLYVGAGFYFDRFYSVSDRGAAPGVVNPFTSYPYGTTGPYNNVGISVDLLYESRDNPVNATHGYYATATYRAFPTWLGSDYDWQSFYVDGRAYFSLPKPNVLALWAYGWFSFGHVPYLNLPSIGSDPESRSGRGYIEGRHIGKSLLYAEAEYRFQIWDFVGGAVGLNVHSASQAWVPGQPQDTPAFRYWYPAATVGIRVLVNKPTRANGLIEYGLGLDGSHGIYLNINENF